MMTPRAASSCFRTYPAIAPATRRTLSKVKSLSMKPRQPSVPNLIGVVMCCSLRNRELRAPSLRQPLQSFFIEMLYNFTDILRVVERGDQQCIIGFYDY